jgi:uncharacterized protein (TIGR03435 family)
MKRREKSEILDQSLGLFNEPSPARMEEARANVLRRLKSKNDGFNVEIALSSDAQRSGLSLRWALTAAVAIVVLLPAAMLWYDRAPGVLQTADGVHKMAIGELVRSHDREGIVVILKDGSHAEMRSNSELALENAADGVVIRLDRGSVIVTAAKQRAGHLYVRTRDVTVSVIGTVFLVNAEEAGSRVAVIQGEVHVQQGATLKKLWPGEQVASNPQMASRPVREEIAWSREAPAHLELMEQSIGGHFDAISIRPHSALSPNGQESLGFVCHGIDGNQRTASEFISNTEGRIVAPQGRCVGKGVLLANLIAFAYRVPPRDVSGLPEWAIPPERVGPQAQPANAFQIEAVAEDTSTATTEQLRQMVLAMLVDRFKLRAHREPKESSGYALVVAKGGPKVELKEVVGGKEMLPSQEVNDEGKPVVRGRSTMEKLALWLGGYLGGVGSIGSPVVDKTGLNAVYEYELVTVGGGGGGGARGGPPQGQAPRPMAEILADIQKQIAGNLSNLMEEQLGLRLQAEKTIPIEGIVIEHVERPSPN